jgi:hypothetical protein
MELHMPVKLAYKLNHRVLFPGPIELQSVQNTTSIFHESTAAALRFYANNGYPTFSDTADFLDVILAWWKLVNAKSTFKGIQKRDPQRDAITHENLVEKTSFLRAFVQWLSEWESSCGDAGLSKETFQAAKHSSESLASIAEHVIQERQFQYFLPGKCQSDKIEGKFGQYRQMNGGNLFASVLQFLESERTLRIKNLAKLELTNAEIKEIFSDSCQEHQQQEQKIIAQILDSLSTDNSIPLFPSIPEFDQNALFYVAGCFTRQISKAMKCESCKDLSLSKLVCCEPNPAEIESIQSSENFLSQVDRGGLTIPSQMMFISTVQAWQFYNQIMADSSLSQLLHSPNVSSRNIFVSSFIQYLDRFENTRLAFIDQTCDLGHSVDKILTVISKKCFNIFSKNYISVINSEIHASRKRQNNDNSKRDNSLIKAAKLQSNSI